MYELVHEGNKWVLYVDHNKVNEFLTLEQGVEEIERLKQEQTKGDI